MAKMLSLFEKSKRFKPGEIIIYEGDTSRDIYVLSEGVLEATIQNETVEVVVSEMRPPEILGEISFLNGSPRTATVTAKTDVLVYVLKYEDVSEEMEKIPNWFRLILKTLTKRMQSCDQKISEMENEIRRLKGK